MSALLSLLVAQAVVGHHVPPKGQVSISRNLTVRFYRGGGRAFDVSGNNNRITIRGDAARIVVRGNGNTVRVDGVGVVEVPGDRNHVVFVRGLGGRPPKVVVLGSRNTVGRS